MFLNIKVAYIFCSKKSYKQYSYLRKYGYIVIRKKCTDSKDIDNSAEIILQSLIDYKNYNKTLIISNNSKLTNLLRFLEYRDKLFVVKIFNSQR